MGSMAEHCRIHFAPSGLPTLGARATRGSTGCLVLGAFALAFVLVGCIATETSSSTRAVTVSGPPPQRVAESPGPAPAPDSFWVAGYWHWTGMSYAWIPGHWERQPPGAIWQAPRYSLSEGRHVYEPGLWARPR